MGFPLFSSIIPRTEAFANNIFGEFLAGPPKKSQPETRTGWPLRYGGFGIKEGLVKVAVLVAGNTDAVAGRNGPVGYTTGSGGSIAGGVGILRDKGSITIKDANCGFGACGRRADTVGVRKVPLYGQIPNGITGGVIVGGSAVAACSGAGLYGVFVQFGDNIIAVF